MNVVKLEVKPNLTLKITLDKGLDKGSRSRDQWIQAILLVESFKLVPKAFRWESKTKKVTNWGLKTYIAPVLEGKSIGSNQKTVLKGESSWFGEPKNQARHPGTLQLKDSILLHMSPNWFLGNWTLDP